MYMFEHPKHVPWFEQPEHEYDERRLDNVPPRTAAAARYTMARIVRRRHVYAPRV